MLTVSADDPIAAAAVSAIQTGDVNGLRSLITDRPELAAARIVNARGTGRTLLHVATDWPGHFPNVADTIAALVAAGADANAPVVVQDRKHAERPLHWAASSDDVAAVDALLDGGADIEAPGAVSTGGTAMSDAVVFKQWNAARRLLDRGASTTFWQAAALGLTKHVAAECGRQPEPSAEQITVAFWNACRDGQRETAEYLVERGANVNWIGPDGDSVLATAQKSGKPELVDWLRSRGAK